MRTVLAAAFVALAGLAPALHGRSLPQERITEILKLLGEQDQSPDKGLLEELGQIGTLPALRGLERIAEDLKGEYAKRNAYSAMRHFLPKEDLRDRALSFVVTAAKSRDATEARAAAGALSWFGAEAHAELFDVADKASDEVARAHAISGIRPAIQAEPSLDALELVLRSASVPQSGTRPQVIELFRAFRTEKAFEVLAKFVGNDREALPRKRLIIAAMAGHAVGASTIVDTGADRVLSEGAESKDSILQYYSLTAMARRGGTQNVRVVEKLVRAKDPTVRRAALLVGARVGAKKADVRGLARSKDPIARQAASIVLGESDGDDTLMELHALLGDEDRIVRAEVIRALAQRADLRSIPLLIERFEAENGRLQADLADALETITGRDYGMSAAVWGNFWAREGPTFVRPSAEELAVVREERAKRAEERAAGEGATAVSFYGLEIVSNRFALIIDTSGSMSAKAYTGPTRIDVAKTQLEKTIERLSDGVLFNVIAFASNAYAMADGLVTLSAEERERALAYARKLNAGGGTNIHDALQAAFRDMRIDTIYLMSDGAPSGGPINDPVQLRDEVERWNSVRGITIHCIAVGQDHEFLKGLAADTGGKYVRVD